MNVRKVLQRIDDFVALRYSTFAFPCIYVYTQGIVECIEWEYMPSIFVNAGCKTVRDDCEFIYGRKKKCVSGRMEFQNRVGRFFLFCSKFLYGDDRETICPNEEISGSPLKSLKKLVVGGVG